jgi:hypothetical protein
MKMELKDFFAATAVPTESQRYRITEIIGKGSYGVVASAIDQFSNGRHCTFCGKMTFVWQNVCNSGIMLPMLQVIEWQLRKLPMFSTMYRMPLGFFEKSSYFGC